MHSISAAMTVSAEPRRMDRLVHPRDTGAGQRQRHVGGRRLNVGDAVSFAHPGREYGLEPQLAKQTRETAGL